ncbi:MAG TPA: YkgJ family cysteine cluster protein [Pirellulaceae bacterium]|nr:YkgJ family cysteine cluster protein [Pirellulaceae bacterium]
MANELPWYRDGLRFTCTQCGDCCTGAPGYVWVTNEEIAALAAQIGESVARFEELYVRRVGARKSLREFPTGDCVFFDNQRRKCTVYDARPRHCRTWPFWDSNLKSPADWAHTCDVCPGSGQGKLHEWSQIEVQRKSVKV